MDQPNKNKDARGKHAGQCREQSELERLLDGKLPAELENEIEEHILHCTECARRFGKLLEQHESRIDAMLEVFRTNNPNSGNPLSETAADQEATEPTGKQNRNLKPPTIPGYQIQEEIARGGMGVVYRATDTALDRPVALKMIVGGVLAGPEKITRFTEEAKTIAQLSHPNIVRIYDVGDHQGQPYFAMELVTTDSLKHIFDGTPWTAKRSASLIATLARAVHEAHRKQIVHRDLKPANILVDSDKDGADFPYIVDFGLAKNLDAETLTMTGEALGTPFYMSPEQAAGRNESVGPSSDTYALGCILYELLTGRPPFRAAAISETLQQVIGDEPASLRSLNAAIPFDLETICLKCLQKDPGRRYSSALELAEDLDRFIQGRRVTARRASVIERIGKWCRRHPAQAIVTVVSAAAILVILSIWIRFTNELANQTTIALRESARAKKSERLAKQNEKLAQDNEQKAKDNALKAERSAEIQIEGMEFLNDMTYELTTLGSQDKLHEALLESEKKIKDRLQSRPLPMAAYLLAMGNTLGQIGQHSKALEIVNQAEDIFVKHVGKESKNTTRARIIKLGLLINLHHYQEARKLVDLLESGKHEFFAHDTRQLLVQSANLHYWEGDLEQAVTELEDVIETLNKQEDLDYNCLQNAHGIMAIALARLGRMDEAGVHFKAGLDSARENFPPGHWAILQAENTYGVYLSRTGRANEAVDMYRKSHSECEKRMGPNHRNTLELQQNLAAALSRCKRYDESEELYLEAARLDLEHFGQNNPLTIQVMNNLTVDYLDRKLYKKGFDFLEKNCDVPALVQSPGNGGGRLVVYYIWICIRAKEWDRGSELFKDLDKIVKGIPQPDPFLVSQLNAGPAQLAKMKAAAEAKK